MFSFAFREMDKRLLIPGLLIIILAASIAIYNPYNALSSTTATFGGIVLHVTDSSSTIFIAFVDITNPSNNVLTISEIHASMQINETDYNSFELGVETYTVPPGEEIRISIPIMNTGTPVQYQPEDSIQKYALNSTITMTFSTSSLGMTAEKTVTLTHSQNWTYDKSLN